VRSQLYQVNHRESDDLRERIDSVKVEWNAAGSRRRAIIAFFSLGMPLGGVSFDMRMRPENGDPAEQTQNAPFSRFVEIGQNSGLQYHREPE
jgi:hypothetical protein